jgi:catechol 2,3-dioxygenase-like lactoylglutathione lyase family enzyme
MKQTLGHLALVVRDYDEALEFFTRTLNFTVVEDTRMSDTKRWVLVAPPGSQGTSLLLAQAATPEQASRIGNQTGGRVFLFLHTDDFWRDYNEMAARKVKFIRPPSDERYGCGVRRFVWQSMGFVAVEKVKGVISSSLRS